MPFCIIEFATELPPESEQCFLAAGLVVVFHLIGEQYPFGVDFIGYRGSGEAPALPDEVERDLTPCHIPKLSSLEFVFNHVPFAMHVSTYPFQLLFELEETDTLSFNCRPENLPERFGNINVGYNNGPLLLKPCPHCLPQSRENEWHVRHYELLAIQEWREIASRNSVGKYVFERTK